MFILESFLDEPACGARHAGLYLASRGGSQRQDPKQPAFEQLGTASWYGPGFHGKKTANGEIYDQNKLTAAHRSLPLGTEVEVTHVKNGKSVELKVNDRGPYVEGRVIDLSRAAAIELGIKEQVWPRSRSRPIP